MQNETNQGLKTRSLVLNRLAKRAIFVFNTGQVLKGFGSTPLPILSLSALPRLKPIIATLEMFPELMLKRQCLTVLFTRKLLVKVLLSAWQCNKSHYMAHL